jgi:DNA-directed RNA polymerase subunit RPC12/RpoP
VIALETYAAIVAAGTGRAGADWPALAASHGVDRAGWDEASAGWGKQLAADAALSRRFLRLILDAMIATDGEATLGLDDYVAVNADVRTGRPVAEAQAAVGCDDRRWTQVSYAWMDRLARDPWLNTYFQLRVHKAIAERTRRAPRDDFAVYGPANLVRARRCHHCGALKAIPPRTAYVYCDYCATLFDYDSAVVRDDPSALDPEDVDRALGKATRDQLAAARAAHDLAEYGRICAWVSEVSTEVSPLEYSPRIRDPEYRRRFVHDLIVPWTLATQFDPAWKALSKRFDDAATMASRDKRLERVLALLEAGRAVWRHERALLERGGILARHPDGLDGAMFEYVNVSTFVRPWLGCLGDADQQTLLEAAGVRTEFIAAPRVELTPCGCGRCGAKLRAPPGATRLLCEHCGFILEIATRSFACRGCGATLSLPSVGDGVQCGFCGASWARS